jgi:hypothetical protein
VNFYTKNILKGTGCHENSNIWKKITSNSSKNKLLVSNIFNYLKKDKIRDPKCDKGSTDLKELRNGDPHENLSFEVPEPLFETI